MKKLLVGGVIAVFAFALSASFTFAATPNWNLIGTYTIDFQCTSGCSGNWFHTMNVASMDMSTGNFSGNGQWNDNPSYTWDVTGNVNGSDVTFNILYTDSGAGYTVDATGTIDSDGTLSGTAKGPGQEFTWSTTSGKANILSKKDCKKFGWKKLGFKNQGQCIKYVNKHSFVFATGDIWMSDPSQQMRFSAFDYGNDSPKDKGMVEYWNYTYTSPKLLHYKVKVLCANIDPEDNEGYFMFQIPAGWPGLSGIYVVSYVKDGGTPGIKGDLYGHTATWDEATAKVWCENGMGVSMYPITAGNLVVHD